MKKNIPQLLIGLALLAATPAFAQAPTVVTPTAAPSGAWEDWSRQIKNPTDWLTWGADLRLRNEYFNNALTLTDAGGASVRHEQDYFRIRTRLWASATPVTNLSVNARVAAEPREWMKPSYARQFGFGEGLEWRYGVFDCLNLKWADVLDLPLTICVGRQDVMLGETGNWWLVADGTPFDGSWTMFFDAVRATYQAKEIKTKFDVAFLHQTADPGGFVPTLGSSYDHTINGATQPYYLSEQNEQGAVVYVSNQSLENMQIDGYFIYKNDHEVNKISYGDNADIYTLGSRFSGTPGAHWAYSVEGAYQFGRKQDPTVLASYTTTPNIRRDISAYGGNAYLTYLFKDKLNNQISLVGEYLSGDDPNSKGTDEMFDILWGRWPRWSEMAVFYYVNENKGKVCQMNNLGRIGPSWTVSPFRNMTVKTTYNALFAPEAVPTRAANASLFSDGGQFRGHFVQSYLKYQFNKNVSGHLWGELLWEGNYYAQRDLLTFLRAEMMFTF